ncbi:hypothetical protein [Flavobacterium sp. FlaQc-28]|uniref:hypothetical protein n=1 Tax=Flavobacterium sp. FlaQc-28 TaxID=3374178 RepID=UPI00375823AC
MKKIFTEIIILLFVTNFAIAQTNQYPTSGDVTIRNYSPKLILQRNTDEGGFVAGIQTKMLNGTDNWYFGALHTSSWIVSKGNFENPKLTVFSSGNVGIGTIAENDSGHKLQVNGTIYTTDKLIAISSGTFFNFRSTIPANNYGVFLRQTDGAPFCYMGDANGSASGGGTVNDFAINAAIGELFLNAASNVRFYTSGIERIRINNFGNVGIGELNPKNKLDVNGTIHSKEVKVDMNGWSDFVFKKEYNLPTLEQVEKHIVEKGHLENIPSEKEVLKDGINLGEMNAKLLQKIEELTLYMIEMKKENNLLRDNQIEFQKIISELINSKQK